MQPHTEQMGGQVGVPRVCVVMEEEEEEVKESPDQMMGETKRGSMTKPTTDRDNKVQTE